MFWTRRVQEGALIASGWLHAASLAPQPRGWMQLLSVAVLVAVLGHQPRSFWRGAWLGVLHGTVMLSATFWWLYISMHDYGAMSASLAGSAVVLLALALSLLQGLASGVWVSRRPTHRAGAVLAWGALSLWVDLARARWFTGFPWGEGGYAHVDSVLAVLAPWGGVYVVGAVAAALAAWVGLLAWPPRLDGPAAGSGQARRGGAPARLALAGGLLLACAVWPAGRGPDFSRPTGVLSVALLQSNVAQDAKFDIERLPAELEWHAQRLMQSEADLVITPETAIPLLPYQLPSHYWSRLIEHFRSSGTSALVGAPLGDERTGYTNSVTGLGAGQTAPYRYDKHHLVPFGEFIPWGFRWFVDLMQMPLGDFARGPVVAPSFVVKGERIAPNICYEDVFGEELAMRMGDPNGAPTVFANLTNIGWFGDTVAVTQHLHIARMRTLELQRPMVRATNTGATALIDHRGQVRKSLPPFQRAVLEGEVQGRSGTTPYVWWVSKLGLWPLWILGGAVAWGWLGRRGRAAP